MLVSRQTDNQCEQPFKNPSMKSKKFLAFIVLSLLALTLLGPASCSTNKSSGPSQNTSVPYFEIKSIGPQTAGSPFLVTVVALDAAGNPDASFSGSCGLANTTRTISPASIPSFGGGQASVNVTITKAGQDKIRVSYQGKDYTSNAFDVAPAALDHFETSKIPNVTTGQPFAADFYAKDSFGNLLTSFPGPISINDLTGTLSPKSTGNFSNGIWTGNLAIGAARAGDTIAASGAGKSGTSNAFDVISPAPVPPPPPSITVYITRTGEKYHRNGCRYLSQSRIPISLSDAKAQGYDP